MIIVILVIIIGTNNWEEEIVAMKAMLEKRANKSEEKEVYTKLQKEKITKLTRKLEKLSTRSVTNDSNSEEEAKASVHNEDSNEEVHSKKGSKLKDDGSPGLIIIEQIQNLISNTVKAQLGGVPTKPTYTPSLTPRGLMHFSCLAAINLQNFSSLMEMAT